MSEWILISTLIFIALLIIVLTLIFLMFKKKKEGKLKEPNYKVFFIIGLVWVPAGSIFLITDNFTIGIVFIGMGFAYLAIGLANREKWKNK